MTWDPLRLRVVLYDDGYDEMTDTYPEQRGDEMTDETIDEELPAPKTQTPAENTVEDNGTPATDYPDDDSVGETDADQEEGS